MSTKHPILREKTPTYYLQDIRRTLSIDTPAWECWLEEAGLLATRRDPPLDLTRFRARWLVEVGTDAIKILLYYNPVDTGWLNEIKQAFVERVGDECRALDISFFLETLAYDNMHPEQSFEFACLKPGYGRSIIEEFSRPCYCVDMLKVEIPINSAYLAGSDSFKGNEVAYDWQEAREYFQALAATSKLPFLFLSGGVDDALFREQLELASEANIPFSGVLCGRATWKGGIPVFVNDGEAALEEWLQEQGVQNMQVLNAVLSQCARPWHAIYGGLEAIEVTD
ncbi:tagatose 1,6-diphosphate aldolase [Ktedonobacter robiniae]|uniref:Tagatose-bisphosphate aldolase n=1 Tax=Ktedonobacter robiniae TaxID=2778365 RepID=A0ABQ3V0L0_9CHLR|nr:tagatose 1,6-diphosphate aldolase [Ktedonobacter robiniae]GHO58501.1 hypothetical protein KSB_69760 [Ktedonobacter robiniae]